MRYASWGATCVSATFRETSSKKSILRWLGISREDLRKECGLGFADAVKIDAIFKKAVAEAEAPPAPPSSPLKQGGKREATPSPKNNDNRVWTRVQVNGIWRPKWIGPPATLQEKK
eukprot:924505_1